MLRHGGVRTMAKVTGETPAIIGIDGSERPLQRVGPARVQEQARFLNLAARNQAHAAVLECMALKPEYQTISERLIKAHIAVITNARLDHMEEMGWGRESVADVLSRMIPVGGIVILGERQLLDAAQQVAEARNSRIVIASESAANSAIKAGVAIAREVVNHIELTSDQRMGAEAYLAEREAEPGAPLPRISVNGYSAFPLWSVNDVDTFRGLWPDLPERVWMVFNHRPDRPLRTQSFAKLFSENPGRIAGVLVIGSIGAANIFRKFGPDVPVRRIRRPVSWAELVMAAQDAGVEAGSALVGCGNWKGAPRDAD